MSYFGGKTRKVTTYGRKQTVSTINPSSSDRQRIINVHADLSPVRDSPPISKAVTGTPIRPPLLAKASSSSQPTTPLKDSRVNALKTPRAVDPNTPKGGKTPGVESKPSRITALSAPRTSGKDRTEDSVSLRKHVARSVRRRPVASPKSKSSSPNPFRTTRLRSSTQVRGPITPPRPVRGERKIVEVEIITRRLQTVSIDDRKPLETDSDLRSLLDCSVSKDIIPFSGVFATPDFIKLLPSGAGTPPPVAKLGEASYSEVFTVGEEDSAVVVKVVPLLGRAGPSSKAKSKVELPDCSEIADVVREIEITKRMSQVPGGGFVDFLGSFVVEGTYPAQLLEEWDRHKDECGTESIRPDAFSASQRYALIVLANGGEDLESYCFENTRGWVQAAGVFWQVADALARAEEWTDFEHRDLHEGQILINDTESAPPSAVENYLDVSATGVRATIIDFGLSRLAMDKGKGAVYTPLPEEVYDGIGDQWDVYRAQRDAVLAEGGDAADAWKAFHPSTNALWLHYLIRRFLNSTRTLRKPYARRGRRPAAPKTTAQAKNELLRTRAKDAWTMLQDVDAAFTTKSRRTDLSSAQAVMAWGRRQGWVA